MTRPTHKNGPGVARAVLALLVLVVFVAGAPVLLWHWGHIDGALLRPVRWLRPDDGSILIGLVTLVGWVLWAVLAAMVLVEFWQQVRARLRGVVCPRPRGMVRPLVAGLVAMVVLVVPLRQQAMAQPMTDGTVRNATVASASAHASPVGAEHATALEQGHGSAPGDEHPSSGGPSLPQGDSARDRSGVSALSTHTSAGTTTVRAGEQLWDVAARTLGDPQRWPELAQLNQLDTSQLLTSGQVLHLPAVAGGAGGQGTSGSETSSESSKRISPSQGHVRTVTVHRGDSLWSIAERHLGDGELWPRLVALNPIIEQPDEIEIGWQLRLPAIDERPGVQPAEADGPGTARRKGASLHVHENAVHATGATRPGSDKPGRDKAGTNTSSSNTSGTNTTSEANPRSTKPGADKPGSTKPAAAPDDQRPAVRDRSAPGADRSHRPDITEHEGSTGGTPPSMTRPPTGDRTSTSTAEGSTPAGPSTSSASGSVPTPSPKDSLQLARQVTGGLCLVTAAGLLTGLALRRRQQAAIRALGRTAHPVATETQQFEQGLGHLAADASRSDVPSVDDPATVVIGWREDEPVAVRLDDRRPTLVQATTRAQGAEQTVSGFLGGVITSLISAEWSQGVDLIIVGEGLAWTAELDRPGLTVVDLPRAIELWHEASTQKRFSRDPEQGWARQVFVIDAAMDAGDLAGFLPCLSMSLVTGIAQDSTLEATVVLEARADGSADVGDRDRVAGTAPSLTRGESSTAAGRTPQMQEEPRSSRRALTSCADADPEPDQLPRPRSAGQSAPTSTDSGDETPIDHSTPTARWCRPDAVLTPENLTRFVPQLVSEPARRALVDLHHSAVSEPDLPARWWRHDPGGGTHGTSSDPPPQIFARTPPILPTTESRGADMDHPQLQLLGPVRIRGARGTEPTRSTRQCAECCAWILQYPGRSSLAMANGLVIAETTRRSHVSRLRTWLGHDDAGRPYLPEAYTGRIALHPDVDSDWEQFQALTAAGIDRTPSQSLVDALSLVRGRPMADIAPMQWGWASGLQAEMAAAVRDAAVVLATRSLDQSDLETTEWAIEQGLGAEPDDELLLALQLRLMMRRGEPGAERLVMQITRNARELGVDLRDSTIEVLQDAVSRQPRLEA